MAYASFFLKEDILNVVHTIKKTLLTILLMFLFIDLSIFCGIVFFSPLQWFMHTDFYLNMVNSHEFRLWVLGIPFSYFLHKDVTELTD